jgi:biopolymer transport protein ExbD
MRSRRAGKVAAHLEITAFINLIVVLVPFLLSTAVFSKLAVIDLSLPAKSSASVEKLTVDDLKLEITLRPDGIDAGDRIGGLFKHFPNTATGYDTAALTAYLFEVKAKFPDKREASILAEPNTPYDSLVQVMDAVRSGLTTPPGDPKPQRADLFPNLSVGDAPPVKR